MATSIITDITPANIGAAADSAAMQFRGLYPNGQSMLNLTPGYYQITPDNLPSETFPSGINTYGMLCMDSAGYKHITYISVVGDFLIWKAYSDSSTSAEWYVVQHNGCVPVPSGGTGATNAAQARINLGVTRGSGGNFLNSFSDIPTEEGMYAVAYNGTDVNAPVQDSEAWWWNVIQIGGPIRLTQIVSCPFRYRDLLFIRYNHDFSWSNWYKFQGTAV